MKRYGVLVFLVAAAMVCICLSGCGGSGGSGGGNPLIGSITGVVLDTTGAPISGATVTANGSRSTTTNSAGQYAFTNLVPGMFILVASKTGYVVATGSVQVFGGTATTFNFTLGETLPGTGRIDGMTFDSSAAPLAGVNITTSGGRATFSDANGKFSFRDLPGGHYTLNASKVGYVSATGTVTVLPGASSTFTFVLSPS